MKVLVFSAKDFEIPYLEEANKKKHKLIFIKEALSSKTAMMAIAYDAIAIFSSDEACLFSHHQLKIESDKKCHSFHRGISGIILF